MTSLVLAVRQMVPLMRDRKRDWTNKTDTHTLNDSKVEHYTAHPNVESNVNQNVS